MGKTSQKGRKHKLLQHSEKSINPWLETYKLHRNATNNHRLKKSAYLEQVKSTTGQSRQNVGNNIAVIVFIIGSLQNQPRDGIDGSANVTNLERAKSTMRKSKQKVGGTKTEAFGHIPREFQQLNRFRCLRKKPRAQNKNVEYFLLLSNILTKLLEGL